MPSRRDRAKAEGRHGDGGTRETENGVGGGEKVMEMRALVRALRGAAGVGHGVGSIETFLLMPDAFRRGYDELCERALKPGIGDGPGASAQASAALGKAQDRNELKGTRIGMGGGAGKRFKTFWTVRDERALEMKSRMDRKLRVMSREMSRAFAEWDGEVSGDGGVRGAGGGAGRGQEGVRCAGCGRVVMTEWRYCPNDGEPLG